MEELGVHLGIRPLRNDDEASFDENLVEARLLLTFMGNQDGCTGVRFLFCPYSGILQPANEKPRREIPAWLVTFARSMANSIHHHAYFFFAIFLTVFLTVLKTVFFFAFLAAGFGAEPSAIAAWAAARRATGTR